MRCTSEREREREKEREREALSARTGDTTDTKALIDLLGDIVLDVRVLERQVELVALEECHLVAIARALSRVAS